MSQFTQNIIENLKTLVAHNNLNNLTIAQRSQVEYLFKSLILFLREENHEAFALFQKVCNFDFNFQEEDFNYVDAVQLHKLFFMQPETFNKFLSLIETSLEHYIKQNNLQERADILSKINFIHGTTTNIFALGTSLKPTGKLFKQGIVPFSGELYNGISLTGINMSAISSATVSSHTFIWNTYSQGFIVTSESLIADLQNIFAANQFKRSLANFTHYLISCQRLKQFDENKFKEIMDEADNNTVHERNITAINDYCNLVTAMLEQLKELLTLPKEQLNQKEDELRFSGKIPAGAPLALRELNCQYFLTHFLEKTYQNTVHFESIILEVLELRKKDSLSKDDEVIFCELINAIEKRLRVISTITEQLDVVGMSIRPEARQLLQTPIPIILGIGCKNGLVIQAEDYTSNEFLFEKELNFGIDIPYIITSNEHVENVREILHNFDIPDVEVCAYEDLFAYHKLPLVQEDAFKAVSRTLLEQKFSHYLEEHSPTNFITKGFYEALSLFGSVRAQKLKKAGDARELVAPNGVDCAITTKGIERKHLFRYFAELKEQRPERRFFGYSLFTVEQGKLEEIAEECLQILATEKQEHKI